MADEAAAIMGVAESELFRVKFRVPMRLTQPRSRTRSSPLTSSITTAETSVHTQKIIGVLDRHKDERINELKRMQERQGPNQVSHRQGYSRAAPPRRQDMATVPTRWPRSRLAWPR